MSAHRAKLLSMLALLGAFSGCHRAERTEYASTQRISVAEPSAPADQLWEAVQETLRRHRFDLDRVDRRAGVITTMPVTSQSLFEFWRDDVATRRDLVEATLNPLRRWVEVTISPEGDGAWGRVSVAVYKERLSSPDRQFNSTGAAYQFFGENLPSTTGLVRVTAEDDHWLSLGRDAAMEDHLLRAILRQGNFGEASPSSGQ